MAKIEWDKTGEHYYETGVDHGVLYVATENGYGTGVAWNGLTSVSENPDGADVTDFWADNIKYASMRAAENFKGSIEAYTYPDEFEACDGSVEVLPGMVAGQQSRKAFGLSYRTRIGSDTTPASADSPYKIHLVYGCTVSPTEKSYETVNDSPDAATLSWDFESVPVKVTETITSSTLTFDSRRLSKARLTKLEEILYGTASAEPTLPTPAELYAQLNAVNS